MFGYILICSVQITMTTGILRLGNIGYILAAANAVLIITYVVIQELRHKGILNSYVPFKTSLPIMTEFDFQV